MNKFDKFLKSRKLTEEELMDFEFFCWYEGFDTKLKEVEFGENRRWSREVIKVYQVTERETGDKMGFYAVQYEEGLTEIQGNYYEHQPYKVKIKYKLEMTPEIERIE